MKKYLSLLSGIILMSAVCAQKYTISGTVYDKETGEKLINANIYDAVSYQGAISNNYGFYSLTLPQGKVLLTFSYIGYQTYQEGIILKKDTVIDLYLVPSIELGEVVVIDTKAETIVESSQLSKIEVPVQKIKDLPALLGEVDVLKTIQLLPGIQSGNEGTSGLYVRGGGPDQNLILLDGVPVYNVDHLFGFFSVFNPDAIQNVKMIKGGFPARYGGRLSSVLDIYMKEGNTKEFHGEGAVGLVASKITLEGPVIQDRTSFIVSARRTYIDILAQPFIRSQSIGEEKISAGYYFYDLNAKINHRISDNHRIYLSAYNGKDKAYTRYKEEFEREDVLHKIKSDAGLGWGNITTALRWNYIVNKKVFCNTTLTYSNYNFSVGERYEDEQIQDDGEESTDMRSYEYSSGIDDIALNIDLDYLPDPNHSVKYGSSVIYHTFKPGINVFRYTDYENSTENLDTAFGNKDIYAYEISTYLEDDFRIGSRIKSNCGVHYSGFYVGGLYYHSVQPRISTRFLISDRWSVKGAITQMKQYIHLLTNAGIGLPTDLWLPSTEKVKPQDSWQYAVGTVYRLSSKVEVTLEGFYKTMDNLIEYDEGASIFSFSDDWQDKIVFGKGWSYGAELFIQKKTGKTTGWIGYTLSWSDRLFPDLNFGSRYPYRYDRRHDISVAVTHKFSEKYDVGLTWVYGTGNAVTLPVEKYIANIYTEDLNYYFYDVIEYFEQRNDYRMPAYHRLDAGVNIHMGKKALKWILSAGIYNLYNRHNPFYLRFGYDDNGNEVLKQMSLFPMIPYIRLNCKF